MSTSLLRWGCLLGVVACEPAPSVRVDGASIDTSGSAAFSCATATCDPATQYCYSISIGLVAPATEAGCYALPEACPTPPTCECVEGLVTDCAGVLGCHVTGDQLTLVCETP